MKNPDKVKAIIAAYRVKHREKISALTKKWCRENPDRVKALRDRWKLANFERKRATDTLWRLANKEYLASQKSAWRKANKEKAANRDKARRARLRGADGSHTHDEIKTLASRQKYRCANPICRRSIKNGWHEDHILPLSLGGSDWIRNIQLLCAFCNVSKHNKHPIVWAQRNGLLL